MIIYWVIIIIFSEKGCFMLIDLHMHTAEYSSCSFIDLKKAIIGTKKIGHGY